DGVTHTYVLPGDLVGVVQANAGDLRSRDLHRLELGDRRQDAGLSDVDLDAADACACLPELHLVGDDPARRLARGPEARALLQGVDLHHHAVGLVLELVARFQLAG